MTTTDAPSSGIDTDQAGPTIEIVWLDPAALTADPANPRADVGDVTDLAASIASLGVLQPLIVTPDGDRHRIVTGHRRRAAAITAGLAAVPCVVCADLTGADTLARQLVENIHRAALTTGEQATAYAQLAAFDLSPAQIGKLVGRKTRHVKAALTAASLDETTRSGASGAGLDLEQLATLAEFADEPDAMAALTQAAADGPGHFAHAVARQREARKRAEQASKQLAQAGYVLLAQRPGWSERDAVRRLRELYDGDGQPLAPEAHADCPGRAVYIDRWSEVEHYCMDPKARGHRTRPKPQPLDEADRAERRRVRENNEAWRAATAVRHEHIATACRSRKPPQGRTTERLSTSRSITSSAFSARSRTSSARSDSADVPSPPSRARWSAATQLPKVPSLIPRSRATRAIGLPVSRTMRTAPSRNSGPNLRRVSTIANSL